MSKNAGKTNQRIDSFYGTVTVGEDRVLTVNYEFDTDRLQIVGAEAGSTKTERRYERASGKPKVVSSVPSDGPNAFDAKRAFFDYDWAVATDTNNVAIDGVPSAVCFSYYAQVPPPHFVGEAAYRPLGAFLISGIRKGIKAERIGWHLVLSHH